MPLHQKQYDYQLATIGAVAFQVTAIRPKYPPPMLFVNFIWKPPLVTLPATRAADKFFI